MTKHNTLEYIKLEKIMGIYLLACPFVWRASLIELSLEG